MTDRYYVDQGRYPCRICGKHPKLTKGGALRHHTYPWYHSQNGQPCPGTPAALCTCTPQPEPVDDEPA